ncbi:MAG: ABC transporter permease [Caldilineaceae bacterium]|nr:ABC transporter permease [Caldilineaceae bacterium]
MSQSVISRPLSRIRLRRLQTNSYLIIGLTIIIALLLFGFVGPLLVNTDLANVGANLPKLSPDGEHWLGTDTQGRDVFTVLVLATPRTLIIGLLAGILGVGLGLILGVTSGYMGGTVDSAVRVLADVFMTIPAIAILIVVATNVRSMTVGLMALIIALLAWRLPTRSIRAQTLSLRERAYIQVAKLNGVGDFEIIIKELLPNLLPYIAATFVSTVSWAILTTIGLEALGLGPQNELTLGMMIYWAQFYGAILRGFWWWWMPPIVVIALIFIGLFFTSAGMDQLVNIRLRKVA